ncbi:MAG: hypothetical protein WDO18_09885 [Acidobacteriota bacterium]
MRGWNRNEVRIRWALTSDAYTDKGRQGDFLEGPYAIIRQPRERGWSHVFGNGLGPGNDVERGCRDPGAAENLSPAGYTHGQILVSDIQGRVEAASHNGEVRLERVRGDVRAKTHNGAVRLTDITGAASFEAHNGMIQGRGLLGAVQGTSHNGPLNLELAGSPSATRPRSTLRTTTATLYWDCRRGSRAHVQTDANHGRLDSDFPITVRGRISGDRDARRGVRYRFRRTEHPVAHQQWRHYPEAVIRRAEQSSGWVRKT